MSECLNRLPDVDLEELLQRAWAAVKKADMPKALQGVALKEAIDFLRAANGDDPASSPKPSPRRKPAPKQAAPPSKASDAKPRESSPDEATFFLQLASESGVDEKVLRDVLQLKDGTVHVLPPTRKLGETKAEQTRRVIALVAGAYAHGLDKSPVDAEVVRVEAKRKRCFDTANFAATLKKLKGFSQGSNRNEVMVGSKWLEEFGEAVEAATGGGEGD
jgi:ribosomal protein L12E/L44/L45/RPP1/RPP2